jgi:hypothetical protein
VYKRQVQPRTEDRLRDADAEAAQDETPDETLKRLDRENKKDN